MRITAGKKTEIINAEVKNKFYEQISLAQKKFEDQLEKEVILFIDSEVIPEELIGNYIDTGNSVEFGNLKNDKTRYDNTFKLRNQYPTHRWNNNVKIEEASKTLIALHKKIKLVEKESEKFRSDVSSIVNSFNSDKKLIEAVPEMSIHFTDTIGTALVPTQKINKVRKQLERPLPKDVA